MSLPTIHLRHSGFFAGQFLLTDEKSARTLGAEITVQLTDKIRAGESFEVRPGRTIQGFLLPMLVNDSLRCEMGITPGVYGRFWWYELQDGKRKPATCHKIERSYHTWYSPNIDGWTIGIMGGRTRAVTPIGEPA